ncbi:MAG: hypothetical protein ACREGG_01005 [Candidatus Saccharimonadales bacterium]
MLKYDIRTGVKKIKTKTALMITGATLGFAGLTMAIALPLAAKAAPTQVVVTPPLNSQGWSTNDTTGGGTVSFNHDTTAPGSPHNGALELTTTINPSDKAQYVHGTNTALSGVTELSYSTKQVSPAGLVADPAYQLISFLNGGTAGFTTLVFEPYQGGEGPIVPGTWQSWNVSPGLFWSTRTVICSNGTIVGTAGGPATYTLSAIETTCPDAVVAAFGVNIGSKNIGYDVEADLVNFNGTVYNFEPFNAATSKDQCKDGGWMNVTDSNGNHFKNQGDCVSYVATGGRNQAAGH